MINKNDCTIGLSADKEVLIMTMPIKAYVDDDQDGPALFWGKFKELEIMSGNMFNQMIQAKHQTGILKPNVNGHQKPFDVA